MSLYKKILRLKNYSDINIPFPTTAIEQSTPLNSFRFCPSCGKENLLFETGKSLICSNCAFVFFTNSASAVCGIILINNKILFTVRNREPQINKLDLPGGFVDLNESAEAALQREISEELNLKITHYEYILSFPNFYHYKHVSYNTLDMFYICKVDNFNNIKLDYEIKDFKYLSLEELDIDNDIGLNSIKTFFKMLKESMKNDIPKRTEKID